MRILVLEDNILLGAQLAQDLVMLGHHVIGPYNRLDAAEEALPEAEAAILDVKIGRSDSFALAQNLKIASQPFVFYTGMAHLDLPDPLVGAAVVSKPAPIEHILDRLAQQQRPRSTAQLIIDFLPILRARARELHLDGRRADILVEAALRAALRDVHVIPRDDICRWLIHYIENESRPRYRNFLI